MGHRPWVCGWLVCRGHGRGFIANPDIVVVLRDGYLDTIPRLGPKWSSARPVQVAPGSRVTSNYCCSLPRGNGLGEEQPQIFEDT